MILHVCNLDKFIPPFIKFIKEDFDNAEHQFWVVGDKNKYPYEEHENIYQVGKGKAKNFLGLLRLVLMLNHADKIILHGLFNQRVIIILAVMPWLLKKCYWVIWGGDLYVYQLGERNLHWKVSEFFRRPVIKCMGHLITYIEGDVELAREWYGAKGQYHECIMYLSNVYKQLNIPTKTSPTINIQIGNSADPSNNHLEALEKLLPYKDEDICIYVPLSYGSAQHTAKVIEQGKKWFGEKFVPLIEFIPFEEYLEFLGSIDIAIFNHKRQQAMGNTITLLGLGKIVYIRSNTTQWQLFKEKDIAIFSIDDLGILEEKSTQESADKIKNYFSKENLKKQYIKVFK